jgi:hypothetical protein
MCLEVKFMSTLGHNTHHPFLLRSLAPSRKQLVNALYSDDVTGVIELLRFFIEAHDGLTSAACQRIAHALRDRTRCLTHPTARILGHKCLYGRAFGGLTGELCSGPTNSDVKERQTISFVYSTPRAGKSALLDQVRKEFQVNMVWAMTLTYNSGTDFDAKLDASLTTAAGRLWYRGVMNLFPWYFGFVANQFGFNDVHNSVWHRSSVCSALQLVQAPSGRKLVTAPGMILIDEFSKVTDQLSKSGGSDAKEVLSSLIGWQETGCRIVATGFSSTPPNGILTASGRTVKWLPLPLAFNFRHRLEMIPLISVFHAWRRASEDRETCLLYEAIKSSYGLLGYAVELALSGDTPFVEDQRFQPPFRGKLESSFLNDADVKLFHEVLELQVRGKLEGWELDSRLRSEAEEKCYLVNAAYTNDVREASILWLVPPFTFYLAFATTKGIAPQRRTPLIQLYVDMFDSYAVILKGSQFETMKRGDVRGAVFELFLRYALAAKFLVSLPSGRASSFSTTVCDQSLSAIKSGFPMLPGAKGGGARVWGS